jgi:hypothetical protein
MGLFSLSGDEASGTLLATMRRVHKEHPILAGKDVVVLGNLDDLYPMSLY